MRNIFTVSLLLVLMTFTACSDAKKEDPLAKLSESVDDNKSDKETSSVKTFFITSLPDKKIADEPWVVDENMSVRLLKNINTSSDSSQPYAFSMTEHGTYFLAKSATHSLEMWVTDGSVNGTKRLLQVYQNNESGSIEQAITLNGIDYFIFNFGSEHILYRSDGTKEGSYALKIFKFAKKIVTYNDKIYFSAIDDNKSGFWSSDGTTEGTTCFQEVSGVYFFSDVITVNNKLMFTTKDKLFISDGTSVGTIELVNINRGRSLTSFKNELYYTVENSTGGRELWKSSGTTKGTQRLKVFNPGGSSTITSLLPYKNALFFVTNDENNGTVLYKSAGTSGTTSPLKVIAPNNENDIVSYFRIVNDTMFFVASDEIHGRELWRSDGTNEGTYVLDIVVGTESTGPHDLQSINNTLYFLSKHENGKHVYKTDGTLANTVKMITTNQRTYLNMYATQDTLLYSGVQEGVGAELLYSNAGDTNISLLKDINTNDDSSFYPSMTQEVTQYGKYLYFPAYNGEDGCQLYKTDGSREGTVVVKTIGSKFQKCPSHLTVFDDHLYFTAYKDESVTSLWMSDGTEEGTTEVLTNANVSAERKSLEVNALLVVNNRLFISALYDQSRHYTYELLSITKAGEDPTAIRSITPQPYNYLNPAYLVAFKGELFFRARRGPFGGFQVWKSDGTEEGTRLVTQTVDNKKFIYMDDFTVVKENLYFRAIFSGEKSENVYVMNAIDEVAQAVTSTLRRSISGLIDINEMLYFKGNDDKHGVELWKSSSVTGETVMIKDIAKDIAGAFISKMTRVDETLFFVADDRIHGNELWKSDGTEEGTVMVRDFTVGPLGSTIQIFGAFQHHLVFSVYEVDKVNLYISDGTKAGTKLLER